MDLNQSAVFVRVVEAGSFSAAARLLGLPTSTVSTRVARLEKRLGVTLLQRTTRRLALTEAGELYYRHAAAGMGHLRDAETALSESLGEPQGLLRVTAPVDIGETILVDLLRRLRRECPKLSVDLLLTNQRVDLLAEGVDAAIRAGKLQDSTLIARPVGIASWAAFASADYLAAAPPLDAPEMLRHHCCLQFSPLGCDSWTLSDEAGRHSVTVPINSRVMVNDLRVIRSMALAGEGVALLPLFLCPQHHAGERLQRVLPGWRAKADPVNIVYPQQRFMPPKLRRFVDLAVEEFAQWLPPG